MKIRTIIVYTLLLAFTDCKKDNVVPEERIRLAKLTQYDSLFDITKSFDFKYDNNNRLIEIAEDVKSKMLIEYDESNKAIAFITIDAYSNKIRWIISYYDNLPFVKASSESQFLKYLYEMNKENEIISEKNIHGSQLWGERVFWRTGNEVIVNDRYFAPSVTGYSFDLMIHYRLSDIESPFKGMDPIILARFIRYLEIYIHPDYLPESIQTHTVLNELISEASFTYTLKGKYPESADCIYSSGNVKRYSFTYEDY